MLRVFVGAMPLLLFAAACGDNGDGTAVPGSKTPQVASQVIGLFREAEATTVDRTAQLRAKPAPIGTWDGVSMVLFDVAAGTARDFGPGSVGRFSPDGTRVILVRGTEPYAVGDVILIDVATGTETPLGPGRLAGFIDDGSVGIVAEGQNVTEVVDLATGTRRIEGRILIGQPEVDRQKTPDGYVLRREYLSENPFPLSRWHLEDPSRNDLELLHFDAWRAIPAGSGYLVVATEPVVTGAPNDGGYAPQSTNIFLVHLPSGLATFIATSPAYGPNWPLIADEHYVIWTDDYCAATPGHTRIFDRETGEITEIDATLWLQEFTPDGLIAAGPFGADELIDPETLVYVAVIPPSEAQWSTDYRYASVGQVGGHGGLCP